MSGNNVSDAKSSALTDDKCLYESGIDSGFLSSGNLISSEIFSEELSQPPPAAPAQDSGLIEDDCPKADQSSFMRLDSGIDTCLSQFSNISLKNTKTSSTAGLNDLGSDKPKKTEAPWELYYEQDEDGDTRLHIAILHGFLEAVLALIRVAPHPRLLDTPNDDAQSPLHLAIATGQWRIARWLVVAGARPSPRNIAGDSPLHIAARAGDLNCCRAITDPVQQQERNMLALSYPPTPYQHCEFDQWNYDGQTCVHVAAINGHVEVLRHLVWYGADINAREGRSGYTALHYAIQNGDEKLVSFLLTECKKLNVEAVTYGGRSALQLGLPIAKGLLDVLLNRGVPSPYSSEDEDEMDSDDEIMYEESTNVFKPNMIINASA